MIPSLIMLCRGMKLFVAKNLIRTQLSTRLHIFTINASFLSYFQKHGGSRQLVLSDALSLQHEWIDLSHAPQLCNRYYTMICNLSTLTTFSYVLSWNGSFLPMPVTCGRNQTQYIRPLSHGDSHHDKVLLHNSRKSVDRSL